MGALQDFREQYPQYNKLSDDELAGSLYQKFYADKIPEDEFRQRMGLSVAPPAPETARDWVRLSRNGGCGPDE